ncbi:amino acid/amide ABC transporter ATP-binding protein 2 (HAAT family) [Stella humosa]|uniref:Amino acid/amide ABC transporter ATP-binding protein 2 (HAAT family) n=1 Tax=Stella humosa TaxID=94 RepID=A0A3N1MCV7_9PROT|nr:ABC transporter ATP-binding protein [Stella humosa]ROQ01543.1 amino acid/amide ABC transporter ATP-binding protein 2 (HAAT family) [Stella humosa]BBK31923.1 ABC transporter ATP-binding protein [Stella humosa]
MTAPLLQLAGVAAAYGQSRVLFGVDLTVPSGSAVALLGRNGMGKTTTIRTILGLLPIQAGAIRLGGRPIAGWPAHRIARAGIGLVPEGRQVFPNLTVHENLVATARPQPGGWTLARVHDLFPRLAERAGHLGSELSGGEQQMLAIGRALMTNPSLLILDEATEGLAPLIRQQIWAALAHLRAAGLAILVVDKDVAALSRLCDHHVVLERGRVVWSGSSADLRADPQAVERHLSLAAPAA